MKIKLNTVSLLWLLYTTRAVAQPSPEPSAVQQSTGINGPVTAMTVYDGKLIIGGTFTEADGMPCNGLVTWDGSSFDTLPGTPKFIESTGSANRILALIQYENSLYVGGTFQFIDSDSGIINFGNMARYTGTHWQRLVSTPSTLFGATHGTVRSLFVYETLLYVGGDFTMVDVNAGIPANQLATWNWNFGTGWLAVGTTGLGGNTPSCHAMTMWDNKLAIAGRFSSGDGVQSSNMIIWDDIQGFTSINSGFTTQTSGSVQYLTSLNDIIYAGGDYSNIGQNLLMGLNAYNGSDWNHLNADIGFDRRALFACNDGYIWIGGNLEDLGEDVKNLFIYDVAMDEVIPFSADYNGVDGIVNSIAEYNGELYFAGEFENLLGTNGNPHLPFRNIFKTSGYCQPLSAINQGDGRYHFSIYPNPANYRLNVKSGLPATITISIQDMAGRIIYSTHSGDSITAIDISNLSSGVYLISIHSAYGNFTMKMVKN